MRNPPVRRFPPRRDKMKILYPASVPTALSSVLGQQRRNTAGHLPGKFRRTGTENDGRLRLHTSLNVFSGPWTALPGRYPELYNVLGKKTDSIESSHWRFSAQSLALSQVGPCQQRCSCDTSASGLRPHIHSLDQSWDALTEMVFPTACYSMPAT